MCEPCVRHMPIIECCLQPYLPDWLASYREYKRRIPVFGAILMDEAMEQVRPRTHSLGPAPRRNAARTRRVAHTRTDRRAASSVEAGRMGMSTGGFCVCCCGSAQARRGGKMQNWAAAIRGSCIPVIITPCNGYGSVWGGTCTCCVRRLALITPRARKPATLLCARVRGAGAAGAGPEEQHGLDVPARQAQRGRGRGGVRGARGERWGRVAV